MRTDEISSTEASDLSWPLAFFCYFAVQALARWAIGGNLGLDEAEVILDARSLSWGYGPQPPLYTWLQWGAFRFVPDPLLAMALLKDALLAGTFLSVYALARTAHPPRAAGLAAASMLLLPQIAWESQRALTHTVLVTMLAAVAALVFWAGVLERRRWADAGFGAVIGLGAIAKANFVAVPLALWLAAASLPGLRARLRPAGIAASVAVAAALAIGPLLWMLHNPELAFASSYKLGRAPDASSAATFVTGAVALARASAAFVALPAVVMAALFLGFRRPGYPPEPPALDRFLRRLVLVGLGLALVAVLASGAMNVKDRWLQPVLFLAAPAATLWLLPRITDAGARWLRIAVLACAGLAVIALPFDHLVGTAARPARGNAPIGALALEIAEAFPDVDAVIADPPWLAGNLLYRRPGTEVSAAAEASAVSDRSALLVWMDDPARGPALAAAIGERAGQKLGLSATSRFALPHPWHPDTEVVLFAARLTPGG